MHFKTVYIFSVFIKQIEIKLEYDNKKGEKFAICKYHFQKYATLILVDVMYWVDLVGRWVVQIP